AQSTGMTTLMSFSRDMERAADLRASDLLTAHYGHTAGASELFRHLLEEDEVEEGRATSSWGLWQSHPDTQERIERLESSYDYRHKKGGEADALRSLPDWLITTLELNSSE
ncbi:MAG: M48 family metalloprotease, partial [Thalassolituus sp.]